MPETHLEAAHDLLAETYELEACSRCDIREEWGLVLGDGDCAIGVAVCPHCGYHSRHVTHDPTGVIDEYPYDHMFDVAMRWVPEWHPGNEDLRSDWRCACGEVWRDHDKAHVHVYQHHPEKPRLRSVEHDRYPWKNVPESLVDGGECDTGSEGNTNAGGS